MQGHPLEQNTNYTPTPRGSSTLGFFLNPTIIRLLSNLHTNAFSSIQ